MVFSLQVDNCAWIDGTRDNPDDYCLHGDVTITVNTKIYTYENATVSASALHVLRTLSENHARGAHLIPHCGHCIIPLSSNRVDITGCDDGFDWAVTHDHGIVHLDFTDGEHTTIPLSLYREEVCRFADSIEEFYRLSSPKHFDNPDDEYAYRAFWTEWHERRHSTQSLSGQ